MAANEGGANKPVENGLDTDENGSAGNGAPLSWFQQPGYLLTGQKKWLEIAIAAGAVYMLTRMR